MSGRRWIGVAAFAALFVIGVALATGGSSTEPEEAVTTTTSTTAEVQAEPGQAGDPAEVAVALAAAPSDWLYLDDGSLAVAVADVAASGARDRLVERVVGDVAVARDALARSGGVVWFTSTPLAVKVHQADRSRALVDVWVVQVLSADAVAVPQSRWFTESFELVWEQGAWRLAGFSERPGPTPQLDVSDDPWTSADLASSLAGFSRIDAATRAVK